MKNKSIVTVTSVALGTAGIVMATFVGTRLEAGGEACARQAKIAKPQLTLGSVELTLGTKGGQRFKAGEKPVFELTAYNTSSEPARFSTCVSMSYYTIASSF